MTGMPVVGFDRLDAADDEWACDAIEAEWSPPSDFHTADKLPTLI
jgi:hypothetical protein